MTTFSSEEYFFGKHFRAFRAFRCFIKELSVSIREIRGRKRFPWSLCYLCEVIVIVKVNVKVERLGHHSPEAVHTPPPSFPESRSQTPTPSLYATDQPEYSKQQLAHWAKARSLELFELLNSLNCPSTLNPHLSTFILWPFLWNEHV